MNDKRLNTILWVVAVLITIGMVIYQRATGPTYPLSGEISIGGKNASYKFLRSHDTKKDARVLVKVKDRSITGTLNYRRYKSYDEWTSLPMKPVDEGLQAYLPHQPAAGKLMYTVQLSRGDEVVDLTDEPVIIRFKGAVPKAVLAPHIFFMFFSLLFTIRAGLEALFRRKDTLFFTGVALFTVFIGGLILGPIVQKFAFDAYWTGWPFGHDLTDNKTAVTFIFLLIAFLKLRKNPAHKTWVFVATIVMVAVYLIPHSVMGSEIDHTKSTEQQMPAEQ